MAKKNIKNTQEIAEQTAQSTQEIAEQTAQNTQEIAEQTAQSTQEIAEQIAQSTQEIAEQTAHNTQEVIVLDNGNTVITPVGNAAKLQAYTIELRKCAENIRGSYREIGRILHNVKVEKLCSDNKAYMALISDTLDMPVSTAYRIISAYEKFYLPLSIDKSEEAKKLQNFGDVAVSRLLPLGDYFKIKDVVSKGKITIDMSAREITDKVSIILAESGKKKKSKKKDQHTDTSQDQHTDTSQDQHTDTSQDQHTDTSQDQQTDTSQDQQTDNSQDRQDQPVTNESAKQEAESVGVTFDTCVYHTLLQIKQSTSLIEVNNIVTAFLSQWYK